jgi:tripartite-type tricarboxylate transporter receptor subunit TctC
VHALMNERRRWLAALLAYFALCGAAVAQGFPSKPVRFLVPNPPGGASDIISRLFSDKLSQEWAQPVLVENRPGAATVIGTQAVVQAPADGHTLLVMTLTHPLNAAFQKKMPYDSIKDFTGVTLIARSPIVLVVNPALPIRTLAELIAYAKANPGKLSYASAGTGTVQHMAAEMLKAMAGVNILHVPYKGSSAAHPDLIGGQVSIMFDTIAAVSPHIRSGAVRALAVGGVARSPLLPETPTVAEAGVRGFEAGSWVGLLVRSGTPADALAKLNKDIVAVTNRPEVKARLVELGLEPVGSGAAEFDTFVNAETQRWGALIKQANIVAD